jgi:hypothetical protein
MAVKIEKKNILSGFLKCTKEKNKCPLIVFDRLLLPCTLVAIRSLFLQNRKEND